MGREVCIWARGGGGGRPPSASKNLKLLLEPPASPAAAAEIYVKQAESPVGATAHKSRRGPRPEGGRDTSGNAALLISNKADLKGTFAESEGRGGPSVPSDAF